MVLKFVEIGGELDGFCCIAELPLILAGTNETNVEPSAFVIKLLDLFIPW